MRILLDECLPRQLRHDLAGHDVMTVASMGWAGIENGALLRLAEYSFDVFITIDQNMQYQRTLQQMNIAIVLLRAGDNRIETLQPMMPKVLAVLAHTHPGEISNITP